MMQLLVIVLNKLECLDKLLTALEEEHIPGATILDSRGMAQQLEAQRDDISLLFSRQYGLPPEEGVRAAFALMSELSEESLQKLQQAL